jgi:hypothetical protein
MFVDNIPDLREYGPVKIKQYGEGVGSFRTFGGGLMNPETSLRLSKSFGNPAFRNDVHGDGVKDWFKSAGRVLKNSILPTIGRGLKKYVPRIAGTVLKHGLNNLPEFIEAAKTGGVKGLLAHGATLLPDLIVDTIADPEDMQPAPDEEGNIPDEVEGSGFDDNDLWMARSHIRQMAHNAIPHMLSTFGPTLQKKIELLGLFMSQVKKGQDYTHTMEQLRQIVSMKHIDTFEAFIDTIVETYIMHMLMLTSYFEKRYGFVSENAPNLAEDHGEGFKEIMNGIVAGLKTAAPFLGSLASFIPGVGPILGQAVTTVGSALPDNPFGGQSKPEMGAALLRSITDMNGEDVNDYGVTHTGHSPVFNSVPIPASAYIENLRRRGYDVLGNPPTTAQIISETKTIRSRPIVTDGKRQRLGPVTSHSMTKRRKLLI